jgi:hypothetical protein
MTKTKLAVTFLWSILAIGTCYTTYNSAVTGKEILETINMFLLMLGGYGVVLSIIHQTETILLNNIQISENIKFETIENTFQLLKDWDDEHLFKARKLTREIKDNINNLSPNQLVKKIEDDPELRQSVILVANYFEHIRFSIKEKRINCIKFKESLGVVVIDIINRFEPYFKKLGEQSFKDMEELKELLS